MTADERPGEPADTGARLDAELRRLTDDERRRAAAQERRHEHWLRRQAAEEGTFTGVLVDLGEREQVCAVTTRGGRSPQGVVRSVGRDFVGLRTAAGELVLVPLAAVTSVRPEPGSVRTTGDRLSQPGTDLADLLVDAAAERPRASVHTVDGHGVAGALLHAGRDVLVVGAGPGGTVYVPLWAVADVTLG